MDPLNPTHITKEGDLVELVSPTNKIYFVLLEHGKQLHTHRGIVEYDDLIGRPWGTEVETHLGGPFFLLQPSLSDILKTTKRNTQILYPKDIGFILLTLGIGPGKVVLEAGTGSGALTTALAYSVGPQGRVYSYDSRPEMQSLAAKNLARVNLLDRVELKCRDAADGFDEVGVDALFLDLPNPSDYLVQVRRSLKTGGFFGTILPTTNQVSRLIQSLHPNGFAFVEICELILRYYKANAERFRPVDRMVAHTGYLIFARTLLDLPFADEKGTETPSFTDEPLAEDQPAE